MIHFFGALFGFFGMVLGLIGYLVLDVIILCAAVVVCGGLLAFLFSAINDLMLKGKPDYNEEGTAAMLIGCIVGGVLSFIFTLYLLCTTTAHATFMSMLGVAGVELFCIVVCVLVTRKVARLG